MTVNHWIAHPLRHSLVCTCPSTHTCVYPFFTVPCIDSPYEIQSEYTFESFSVEITDDDVVQQRETRPGNALLIGSGSSDLLAPGEAIHIYDFRLSPEYEG